MTPKSAALIIGIIFIVVGLLGFVPNPIVGAENAIFHADTVHNLVHIISGGLFVLVAIGSPGNASLVLKIFGVVYFLLGVWGIFILGPDGMGSLLGFLHVNANDNYLHIALGIVIFLAGMLKGKTAAAA